MLHDILTLENDWVVRSDRSISNVISNAIRVLEADPRVLQVSLRYDIDQHHCIGPRNHTIDGVSYRLHCSRRDTCMGGFTNGAALSHSKRLSELGPRIVCIIIAWDRIASLCSANRLQLQLACPECPACPSALCVRAHACMPVLLPACLHT